MLLAMHLLLEHHPRPVDGRPLEPIAISSPDAFRIVSRMSPRYRPETTYMTGTGDHHLTVRSSRHFTLEVWSDRPVRLNVADHGVRTLAPVFVDVGPGKWVALGHTDLHLPDAHGSSLLVSTAKPHKHFAILQSYFQDRKCSFAGVRHLAQGCNKMGLLWLADNPFLDDPSYRHLSGFGWVALQDRLLNNPCFVRSLRRHFSGPEWVPPPVALSPPPMVARSGPFGAVG
jgi:hypothetical protein